MNKDLANFFGPYILNIAIVYRIKFPFLYSTGFILRNFNTTAKRTETLLFHTFY